MAEMKRMKEDEVSIINEIVVYMFFKLPIFDT